MAKQKSGTDTVSYMGRDYQVDRAALTSMKVNRALVNAESDMKASYDAMDAICCGRLDEYLDVLPEPDGGVGEYGASFEAFNAFLSSAAEQVGAKN